MRTSSQGITTTKVAAIVIAILVVAGGSYYAYNVLKAGSSVTPESHLVVYGSIKATDVQGVISSFGSKFPSVTVDYQEMTPPVGYTRITSEVAGNKSTADLTLFTNSITVQLVTGHYLASYNSSERSAYPANYQDSKGYWTAAALIPTVIAYNTQLLNKSTIPTTLADLSSARWKGKVIMHDVTIGSTGTQYLVSLASVVGNQTWTTFVQNLATNVHPTLTSDTTAVSASVASGQYQIGIIAYLQDVLKLKSQGAPVDWYLPSGVPLMTVISSAALMKVAQHPIAAKLFVDFILSATGQKALGDAVVRIPARPSAGAAYSLESVAQGQQVVFYPTDQVVAAARAWGTKFKQLGFGA